MTAPLLLDLFCGAGGAAKGYHDAGFQILGVDIEPQPSYPFEFRQDDAIETLRRVIAGDLQPDAIHASPPCPAYSLVSGFQGVADDHPDLIAPVRALLQATGLPWVMENVPGAPLRKDVTLCGEMFGLRVHRHRWFEIEGAFIMQARHQPHRLRGARTNCELGPGIARWITGNYADHTDASDAMGIDWMSRRSELANAIPPAYTRHIGEYLLSAVEHRALTVPAPVGIMRACP